MNNMLYRFSILILLLFGTLAGKMQAQQVVELPGASVVSGFDAETRLPGTGFRWEADALPDPAKIVSGDGEATYRITQQTNHPFTGLAIGWSVRGENAAADEFIVKIRSRKKGEEWHGWVQTRGYLHPEDSPSGLYWSMLYATADARADNEFEVVINTPQSSALTELRISAADARSQQGAGDRTPRKRESHEIDQPEIIGRAGWWGSLPDDELEPGYTPRRISITHAAVHHTVTVNEPPDPAQVIRQIWDWHVNDNGWLDIGYNFLIDHEGTIYQGRYNPWLSTTDVRGAHAGRANSRSIGIALLGQFEPGASPQVGNPAALALDALVKMISWRFGQRGIDPLGRAVVSVNPDGSRVLPRIFGHRDVSATACPGENLFTQLPDVRSSINVGDPVAEAAPFDVGQNYPNPFRESTTIPFTLDEEREVELLLYTVTGEKVRTIFRGTLGEGEQSVPFRPGDLSSGVYVYELVTGEFRRMMQMIYIR